MVASLRGAGQVQAHRPVDQHGLEHHERLQHHARPLVGAQDGLPHGGEDDAVVRYGDAGRGKWDCGTKPGNLFDHSR